jgi:alpha-L-fucosidase
MLEMKKLVPIIGLLFLIISCSTQDQGQVKDKAVLKQDAKMKWWREARFGMFIHWGLYSIPAGEWKGEQIPGISEWIMYRARIPVAEYEKLAAQFDPQKYDAEKWVKMAKEAGMKYIVITSKHHDGFAMFNSKASKYNIVDATPFDRDPLKELADACKKHGMRLGFYYSQAQDWHEPGSSYAGIDRGMAYWDTTVIREPLMNYIDSKSAPQVKEILENYGGLDILWWDTPDGMTEEAASKLKTISDEYPDLITNDRLFRSWPGDFTTPEQYIPPTGLDYDWEVCMTMNTSWGYKKNDNNWKSAETLIRMLTDIASKGGNFLLNVGPTSEGLFPDESIQRLAGIGKWMEINGESIYGTSPSPFYKLPWGRCTSKKDRNSNTLYLHVFNWPEDGIIRVPGLIADIKKVYLLAEPKRKINYHFENSDLLIDAHGASIDTANTVIAVKTGKVLEVTSNKPVVKNGSLFLTADFAELYNPGYGTQMELSGTGMSSVIKNWSDQRARLEWVFAAADTGRYRIEAMVRTIKPGKLNVRLGEENITTDFTETGDQFAKVILGEMKILNPGDQVISLRPVRDNWGEVELMNLELVRNN